MYSTHKQSSKWKFEFTGGIQIHELIFIVQKKNEKFTGSNKILLGSEDRSSSCAQVC